MSLKKKRNVDGEVLSNGERVLKVFIHIILIALALCCLYPFLVILGSSFQTEREIMERGYAMIPNEFTLDAYKTIFARPDTIIDAYKVTIFTTVIGTIGALWLVSTCGYVMSRQDFVYKRILSFYVFFTMLFNGGLVSTYILISNWLDMKDNIWVLIIPGMCTAWNIMLMKGFFQSIPVSLIEAGKIDGLGEFGIFTRIIIPLSKPAFATIGLLLILTYWNEWYYSMLYLDDRQDLVKLQYLLQSLMKNIEYLTSAEAMQDTTVVATQDIPASSTRMAMCILAAGPILVVFPFFQKYFVKGMTVGAVKG